MPPLELQSLTQGNAQEHKRRPHNLGKVHTGPDINSINPATQAAGMTEPGLPQPKPMLCLLGEGLECVRKQKKKIIFCRWRHFHGLAFIRGIIGAQDRPHHTVCQHSVPAMLQELLQAGQAAEE